MATTISRTYPDGTIVTETPATTSYFWLYFLIFFIILIIIIILIWWFAFSGRGTLAIGAACTSSSQCASGICAGGFCQGTTVVNPVGTVITPGTVPGGGTCSSTTDCISGLTCTAGVCLASIGGQCTSLRGCVSSATACYNNICVSTPLSPVGGTPPCQSGLVVDSSSGTAICRVPIGGTCSTSTDCITGGTCTGGICVMSSGGGGIGGTPPCMSGLINDSGVCKVPVGGTCSSSSDCTSTSGGCISGRCTASKGRLDSKCTVSTDCNTGLTCDGGRCKISPSSVIPCCDDRMCSSGSVCMDSVCTIVPDSSSSSSSCSSCETSSQESSSCDCGKDKTCRQCRARGKLPTTSRYF